MGPPPAGLRLPIKESPLPFPKYDPNDKKWTAFRGESVKLGRGVKDTSHQCFLDPSAVNGERKRSTDMWSVTNDPVQGLTIKKEIKEEPTEEPKEGSMLVSQIMEVCYCLPSS